MDGNSKCSRVFRIRASTYKNRKENEKLTNQRNTTFGYFAFMTTEEA